MKKFCYFLCFLIIPALNACSPKTRIEIVKRYPPLDHLAPVELFRRHEDEPEDSELLASLIIKNGEWENARDYESLLFKAKAMARELGGNAVKVTQHQKPFSSGMRVPIGGTLYPYNPKHKMLIEILRVTYEQTNP